MKLQVWRGVTGSTTAFTLIGETIVDQTLFPGYVSGVYEVPLTGDKQMNIRTGEWEL